MALAFALSWALREVPLRETNLPTAEHELAAATPHP
jgi:hypothetical protein